MEISIRKEKLEEICLKDFNGPISINTLKVFTEDINISGYVICKHSKGHYCPLGIAFGDQTFCKSDIIYSVWVGRPCR